MSIHGNRKSTRREALQSIASEFEESQRRLSEERSDLDMVNDALISVEDEPCKTQPEDGSSNRSCRPHGGKGRRLHFEKDLARIIHHTTELRSNFTLVNRAQCVERLNTHGVRNQQRKSRNSSELPSSNLSKAEKELQAEKKKLQNLDQGKIRGEATKSNMKKQISESRTKIASLNKKIDLMQVKWKKTYPQNDISLKWTQQKIETAMIYPQISQSSGGIERSRKICRASE